MGKLTRHIKVGYKAPWIVVHRERASGSGDNDTGCCGCVVVFVILFIVIGIVGVLTRDPSTTATSADDIIAKSKAPEKPELNPTSPTTPNFVNSTKKPISNPPPALTRITYHVIGITRKDRLNVRENPGEISKIIGTLAPGANGIEIIGDEVLNGPDIWVPIQIDGFRGWVHYGFLRPD